ncbi:MAG: SDR family NAD(P)-dependent oxidoreductase, partial [Syntrophobacterales bacterium]
MNNLFSLEGEIGVVTGGLGKLGPIWIETLLDAGAAVFVLDRPGQKISEQFSEIQRRFPGNRLRLAYTDVRDRSALETVCKECLEIFGVPSILVNNAGIDRPPDQPQEG